MQTIKGYIDRISYRDEESGYTVMILTTETGSETCVGSARGFGVGETVEVDGEYVDHSLYGKQLKFSAIRSVAPSDRISVIRYLGSGTIKGLGEKLATRIVDKFGDDTLRVMDEEPERLVEIKGISARMAQEITDQMVEKREQRNAMLFLQQYGLSPALADRVYRIYGSQVYTIIRNNPYRMAEEVPAVGFKRADAIAQKAGIRMDSEYRIRCAVVYQLSQLSQEGHCYYPEEQLCENVAGMLGLEAEAVREELDALAIDGRVVQKRAAEGARVYLNAYYKAEQYCAGKLVELRDAFSAGNKADTGWVASVEKSLGIELDELQRKAVIHSDTEGVFVLSGGPGTGKTTTINAILRRMETRGRSFVLAAPTGRAAKRMQEATSYEAQTIHRLLEIGGDSGEDNSSFRYGRDESEPLDVDCVIIDEVSMVDIHLLKALLAATAPGTRLILVGDVDQLPSVGPGQVLKDILDSEAFATVRLEHVFRQAGESHIVEYAHLINRGEHIDLSRKYEDFFLLEKDSPEVIYRYIVQLISDVLPRKLSLGSESVQVLTPMRKGMLGVETLNRILQEKLNPPTPQKAEYSFGELFFREGDKVMQIKNDYQLEWEICGNHGISEDKGTGVFNGDVGTIRQINSYLKLMQVEFDDRRTVYYSFQQLDELELAYAVTIHKSQGSEYPLVILPILSGPRMLLSRNLLYTAVTRAKQCVILIGSGQTIQQMIDTDHVQHRYTSLKERIREAGGSGDGMEEDP